MLIHTDVPCKTRAKLIIHQSEKDQDSVAKDTKQRYKIGWEETIDVFLLR